MENLLIIKSNFVYSKSKDELIEKEEAFIVINNGVIEDIYDSLPDKYKNVEVKDLTDKIIIPSFSDLHVHAPQYPQRGIALDELLYNWLNKYTFVTENKYKDIEFAKRVYDKFVNDLISNGTLHAVVFGTIHKDATQYLVDVFEKKNMESFIGKVNMDKSAPDYLCETVSGSIKDTEEFIINNKDNKFAKPIITPRFAPTCSKELMDGLGELASKYHVGVQTHLVESLWEKQEAINCFPGESCDTQIYEDSKLIKTSPFVGAHFIFPSEKDIEILAKYGGFAVHCPEATVNVMAGIMPIGNLLDRGINIGLGSDVAAGTSVAIYKQIAMAVRLSKIKAFYEKNIRPVTFEEAFYLATKSGGKLFEKTGSLEPGYFFDALVIDKMEDEFAKLNLKENVERFCYSGTEDNIKKVYLRGNNVKN
jgi:guanine deaminase